MMEDKAKQAEETSWDHVWFLSRVAVGFIIHVLLIICAIGFTEHAVELSYLIKDHSMHPRITALMTGVSAFTAAMSGVYWVKAKFIQCCLSECMDDATKKLNQ